MTLCQQCGALVFPLEKQYGNRKYYACPVCNKRFSSAFWVALVQLIRSFHLRTHGGIALGALLLWAWLFIVYQGGD